MIQLVISLAACASCVLAAYGLGGRAGLGGAIPGALMALVLCGLSHVMVAIARRSGGTALIAAMLGGALASLLLLAGFVLLIARVWTEAVLPAALTALVTYLAYKFSSAISIYANAGAPRGESSRC